MNYITTGSRLGLAAGLFWLAACSAPAPPQATSQKLEVASVAQVATRPKLLVGLPDSLQPAPVAELPGVTDSLRQAIRQLHAALGPAANTLRPAVLERACTGYLNLRRQGQLSGPPVLAVADMELPSIVPRLWVIDLRRQVLLEHSHVAHGRGSGGLSARRFSDRMKSACTALGFYRTGDTYSGRNGLSRRLHGLDKGYNGHALQRYVVLHGADYASPEYMQRYGQLGNSRGCPALPPALYRRIVRAIGEGACLFIHGADTSYASRHLNASLANVAWHKRGWL